jgi:hypothetical protein
VDALLLAGLGRDLQCTRERHAALVEHAAGVDLVADEVDVSLGQEVDDLPQQRRVVQPARGVAWRRQ